LYPAASRLKSLLGGHATAELRALLADAHSTTSAEALACRARAALSVDVTSALTECPVPVLYLRASEDRVIRSDRADDIRRKLSTVEIVDILGPHLALATHPSASWAAIQRFMEKTETANPGERHA
jgi:pimeloyl-ACP methyl ester carboxylesterase